MSNDPKKTGLNDAQRIKMSQDHEVRYWTERFRAAG
jgi:hypothetical protein